MAFAAGGFDVAGTGTVNASTTTVASMNKQKMISSTAEKMRQ